MPNPLTYSDQVPTVPGWYWRRGPSGVSVVQFPKRTDNGPTMRSGWPLHWEQVRDESISLWPAKMQAKARANVAGWRVEYAGPILPPV